LSGNRRPAAAVREFKSWLSKAVSCVTSDILVVSPGAFDFPPDETKVHTVSLKNDPVLLDGDGELFLSVLHNFTVSREEGRKRWRVHTAAYEYGIRDIHNREVILYHWHPQPHNRIRFPHLHVEAGTVAAESLQRGNLSPDHNALRSDLQDCHLPTRRIALEDVLRMLIEQLKVEPVKTDWDRALNDARSSFSRTRNWC
jgi:hypothetical protein